MQTKLMLTTVFSMLAAAGDTGTLENNLNDFGTNFSSLFYIIFPAILGIGLLVIIAKGVHLGWKIINAKKTEERIDAKAGVKQLIIGVLVVFIIAIAASPIISGLASWAGVSIVKF